MVYIMEFYVDGGCRGNGKSYATGAAAACLMHKGGQRYRYRATMIDDSRYTPTSQRAEITAIIEALEWALDRYDELEGCPRLKVKIKSDSRYAVGCMTVWVYKWANNGWLNSRGEEVANRDLIEEASDLDDKLRELGSVEYNWVPRNDNRAHEHCDELLDN